MSSSSSSSSSSSMVGQAVERMTAFVNMLLSSNDFQNPNHALDMLKDVVDNKQKLKSWESGGYKPDDNEPDDNEPDDNEPDDNEPDDNEPDDNEPGDNEPDDNEPGDNELTQVKPRTKKAAEKKAKVAAKQAAKEAKVAAKEAKVAAKQAEKAQAKQVKQDAKQTKQGNTEKKTRGRPKATTIHVVDEKQPKRHQDSSMQSLILPPSDEEEQNESADLNIDHFLKIKYENTTYWVYKGESEKPFKYGDAFTHNFQENNSSKCGEYDFETKYLVLC